jgi:threonine/homoserine/homoserine lactone efflux protein
MLLCRWKIPAQSGGPMERSHLLVFAITYLVALALPGPGVAALLGRVLARGMHGAPAFIAGTVAGGLAWFTIAATGLAMLASTFAALFVVIRYTGAAYILYLAWKAWTAPALAIDVAAPATAEHGRLFLAGLSVNLGNPKNIFFFLALLPTVVDVGSLTLAGFFELALIITVIAFSVLILYAVLAARARRLFASPGAVRLLNRGSGAVMAGAAVTMAATR